MAYIRFEHKSPHIIKYSQSFELVLFHIIHVSIKYHKGYHYSHFHLPSRNPKRAQTIKDCNFHCCHAYLLGLWWGFHWEDTTPMRLEPNHIRH